MKFLVSADDTGAIKEVICGRGTDTSKQSALQPKSIKNYCLEPNSTRKTRVVKLDSYNYQYAIGVRIGGGVCIYEINDEEYEEEEKAKEEPKETSNEEDIENNYKLLHEFKLPNVENDTPVALIKVEILESIIVAYESSKVFLIHINDKFDFEPLQISLPSSKPISAFAINPNSENIFAFGGEENDLQIIKLFETGVNHTIFKKKDYENAFAPTVVYRAKNVKNDHLDLRVPVWITGIIFWKDLDNGYRLITSTRYGQVRVYDTTHGRRPIGDYQVCEQPIVTLTMTENEEDPEVIITTTHGLIAKHSLYEVHDRAFKTISASAGEIIKPVLQLRGKYSQGGNTGAILAVEACDDIFATAGLDRYLRVFDLESRDLLAKVYLGVEVSSLVVLDTEDDEIETVATEEASSTKKRTRDSEESDDDEEELWDQLENDPKKSKQ
ncbi:Ribosome biogenesis protein NSA1 [Spathaspora sp. JA1]|nr:Ribosome biogenesis protein NSA1 [Spathaspora sp. JA1]